MGIPTEPQFFGQLTYLLRVCTFCLRHHSKFPKCARGLTEQKSPKNTAFLSHLLCYCHKLQASSKYLATEASELLPQANAANLSDSMDTTSQVFLCIANFQKLMSKRSHVQLTSNTFSTVDVCVDLLVVIGNKCVLQEEKSRHRYLSESPPPLLTSESKSTPRYESLCFGDRTFLQPCLVPSSPTKLPEQWERNWEFLPCCHSPGK